MRKRMESLIGEMLDGRILLDEAITEFEKIYIQKALARNSDHMCNTANALGIHRNTLSKRLAGYNGKLTTKKKPAAKSKRSTRKSTPRRTKR
jgi:Fis family transcriptional regulator, factor for inversion stimulation protein